MSERLWVEKYRPRTVKDTILPEDIKTTFQKFVDKKHIPNLILSGGAGVGKTTTAKAMLEELGCDYIVINASMKGNIDTLRTEIQAFASTVSFAGGRKYVILDEADYLNPNSTQPALRNFMEEFSDNCGFILTCNYKNRIIEPLHSRCSVVDFKISDTDKKLLATKFHKRLMQILEREGVEFDKKVLANLVIKYMPDWRRTLNECQRYSATGKIDSGIFVDHLDKSFDQLIDYMKKKNFGRMRDWVGENSDIDQLEVMRRLYDTSSELMKKDCIPSVVLIIARYQYQAAFAADAEINLVACLTEIMVEDAYE